MPWTVYADTFICNSFLDIIYTLYWKIVINIIFIKINNALISFLAFKLKKVLAQLFQIASNDNFAKTYCWLVFNFMYSKNKLSLVYLTLPISTPNSIMLPMCKSEALFCPAARSPKRNRSPAHPVFCTFASGSWRLLLRCIVLCWKFHRYCRVKAVHWFVVDFPAPS